MCVDQEGVHPESVLVAGETNGSDLVFEIQGKLSESSDAPREEASCLDAKVLAEFMVEHVIGWKKVLTNS